MRKRSICPLNHKELKMPKKLYINVGDRFGMLSVTHAAEQKSGHRRWNVECHSCNACYILRGTDLKPNMRCKVCSTSTSADTPKEALSVRLERIETLLTTLTKTLAAGQPAPKQTMEGLPAFSFKAELSPQEKESLKQVTRGSTAESRALNLARLAEIRKQPTKTLYEEEEFKKRAALERDSIDYDPEPERQAQRRAALRQLTHGD